MSAFFRTTIQEFLNSPESTIQGRLSSRVASAGFDQVHTALARSWSSQIKILRTTFAGAVNLKSAVSDWHVLIEYPIPRRERRIDTVLIARDVIFVLEFKVGSDTLNAADRCQTEDYCLDLRDFHLPSLGRVIVPILIATQYEGQPRVFDAVVNDLVKPVIGIGSSGLVKQLISNADRWTDSDCVPIDADVWDAGEYSPTPSIIDAAQALYAGHSVASITRSGASLRNLTDTSNAITRIVDDCRSKGKKAICFVTGVPGAGKTLAGLNIIHNPELNVAGSALGTFLSGNSPLVRVLREALAQDEAARNGNRLSNARRKVSTFIENVHSFIDAYSMSGNEVLENRLIVFDEAQRAWDADQSRRKFQRAKSEPSTMLEIMDRHADWAVIVCLIGTGQEINSGEAGLQEWGRALSEEYPHWRIHISPSVVGADGDSPLSALYETVPSNVTLIETPELHLEISTRTFRASALNAWVEAVLDGDADCAREIYDQIKDRYPMALTRDLDVARAWLRERTRGNRRCGLVASSGARRLRAEGLDVTLRLDVENWFLRPQEDVRSSNCLEVPATEYAIQGLELDWVGVCWGADFRRMLDGSWGHFRFVGSEWQQIRQSRAKLYLKNKYRVLLTRAREGMVIYIPKGNPIDRTRAQFTYDATWEYIKRACPQAIVGVE